MKIGVQIHPQNTTTAAMREAWQRPTPWASIPSGSGTSVVTTSLIDEAGQPTAAVRDEILGIFTSRLQ